MKLSDYKIGDRIDALVTMVRKSGLVDEWHNGRVINRTDHPWDLSWNENFVQVMTNIDGYAITHRIYDEDRIRPSSMTYEENGVA